MDYKKLNKKGVAGLNVYLSLIAMLFMIGVIVMVFQIAGSKLMESSRDATSVSVNGEAVSVAYFTNATGYTLASTNTNARGYTMVALYNNTNELLTSGNYTLTENILKNATELVGLADVKANYTYTYDADNDATTSINETKGAIGESTGFFGTFIVLGAMVVLILLVVIIINSIRATGITEGA